MWRAKAPDPEQIRRMHHVRHKNDLTPLVIHDSYLINLASNDPAIRDNSLRAFTGELERALLIGAEYLVAHPGSYKGLSVEQGIFNVAEALVMAWRAVEPKLRRKPKLSILLENTAGAGAQLGGHLKELATIRELAGQYVEIPIGYCLDTCHCYVCGFDVAHEHGLTKLVEEAGRVLGLQHVPVIHANDAKTKLSSHMDRHANIGHGYIGLEGFRRILNHPSLQRKAFILETPVDKPGDDLRNVAALKELVSPRKHSTTRRSSKSGTSGGRTMRRST